MSSPFERLLREARQDLGRRPAPPVDWRQVDRKLFDRIEREEAAARSTGRASRLAWTAGAAILSAAAAAALVFGRTHEQAPLEAVRAAAEEPAGSVVSIDGDGDLLVNGKPTGVGAVLRKDDVVEARGGARVTVERAGKVTFALERSTRAAVTHVQGALVLSLERGSIEAQVVPVPQGEAFAVDVERSRVAVHGTHLRVERQRASSGSLPDWRTSDLVVVDLNEGVVSVGEAPRIGSTSGTLVTAPAHAEFAADDAQGTLSVTHDAAQVRAPVALGSFAQAKAFTPAPAVVPASRMELGRGSPDDGPLVVVAQRVAHGFRRRCSSRPAGQCERGNDHGRSGSRLLRGAPERSERHRIGQHDASPGSSRRRHGALGEVRTAGGTRGQRVCSAFHIQSALHPRWLGRHRGGLQGAFVDSAVMACVSRAPSSPNCRPIPSARVQRTTAGNASGAFCPGRST